MDWKKIVDDKEKYAAYLCSREWAEKRRQVITRNRGRCQRCYVNGIDHVHHLTYARKYDEKLSDLRGLCKTCHEFTHGKNDASLFDSGMTVYLAGKISRNDDWREGVIGEPVEDIDPMVDEWPVNRGALRACGPDGVAWVASYCGPYFFGIGGHGAGHGDSTHGCAGCSYDGNFSRGEHGVDDGTERNAVYRQVVASISRCTHLIAWIDAPDAYGTIFEIGLAIGMGKRVFVGVGKSVNETDLWLVLRSSSGGGGVFDNERDCVDAAFVEWLVFGA